MAGPQARDDRHDLLGGVAAAVSAVLFGAIIISARHVLERGVPVETMLSIRFAIGALVLLAALLVTRRPVLAEPGERSRLAFLALFGYAIEASLFFTATQHGTVAAVTLLFFTYPVFVTVVGVGARRAPARPPDRRRTGVRRRRGDDRGRAPGRASRSRAPGWCSRSPRRRPTAPTSRAWTC